MNTRVPQSNPSLYSRDFLQLAISNLIMLTGFSFFFIFSLFILHIGGDKTDIGLLMGVMPLSAVIGRPWVSAQVDRIGRKKSYILGGLIMTVASFSYQFFMKDIDSVFYVHLVLRILHGIGFAFCMVAGLTFVSDLVPKSRINEGLGMFGITALIGMAAGPLLAEWLILTMGYRFMFMVATGFCVVAVLIVSPLKERYTTPRSRQETAFSRVVGHPVLIRLSLVALCFGFGFSAHVSFVAPYAQSKGMLASLYFSAYSIAAIGTRFVGGRLADRFGEPRIVPVSLIVTGIGFIYQLTVDSPIDFLVSGFITGTGHGMVLPCLMALAIRPVPPQDRGKANGVLTGGMDLGIFCGSLALGLVGERLGYMAIFTVAGMSMFAGFALFAVWLQRFSRTSYGGA